MKRAGVLLGLIGVLFAAVATAGYASAFPSEGFYVRSGDIFDDWEICRTTAFGEDGFYQITETGFRPVIAFESLGEEADLAYSLGEQIANEYPDPLRRAEAVFDFVRDRVKYTPDIDQTGDEEFAQNADELAIAIVEDGIGYGDCEDMAVLLAVMYKAAGFRSAIALVPEHTAVLVYLPKYSKATAVFELEGEPGWVWAEATGGNNPLGWVPKQYRNVKIATYEISAEVPPYEISAETVAPLKPPPTPVMAVAGTGEGVTYRPYLFFIVIGLLWVMSLFRRRRRR
ncbi:MAG: transglutaminase-like domain-containing protein [Dehalococcoidia bacterium]